MEYPTDSHAVAPFSQPALFVLTTIRRARAFPQRATGVCIQLAGNLNVSRFWQRPLYLVALLRHLRDSGVTKIL